MSAATMAKTTTFSDLAQAIAAGKADKSAMELGGFAVCKLGADEYTYQPTANVRGTLDQILDSSSATSANAEIVNRWAYHGSGDWEQVDGNVTGGQDST